MRPTLPLGSLVLALTLSAASASPCGAQASEITRPLLDTQAHLITRVLSLADGDLLVARHDASESNRLRVERLAPDGNVRWMLPLSRPAGAALGLQEAGGGAVLLNTQVDEPGHTGLLRMIEADGHVRWEVMPEGRWVGFDTTITDDGRIFVAGTFFRGTLELPGGVRWTSQRRFTSFLAELDAQTGQARWGRRIEAGEEMRFFEAAPDGTLVLATHRTVQREVLQETYIERFDRTGRSLGRTAIPVGGWTFPQGLRVLPDGTVAVMTSTQPGGPPQLSLALLRPGAAPAITRLPNDARFVEDATASTRLEVFLPTGSVGPYEQGSLARGLRVCEVELAQGSLQACSEITPAAPISWFSVNVTRGATLRAAFATRSSTGGASLHITTPAASSSAVSSAPATQPAFDQPIRGLAM